MNEEQKREALRAPFVAIETDSPPPIPQPPPARTPVRSAHFPVCLRSTSARRRFLRWRMLSAE